MNDFLANWPEYNPQNSTHELIIAYLTIDIQHSRQWIKELLEKIEGIQAGQIDSWERTGNAYCLRLNSDYAEIEEDYAEMANKAVKIPLNEFANAVTAWQKHLNN